jgi:prepilin-type N-terminal cleavage/methylation domain-containing protein
VVNGERGFTLIELTIAVTVFTIAILGMLGATAGITRLLGQGDRIATASFYAQERFETLRSSDCATLTGGSETRGGVYNVTWQVQPMFGGNAQRIGIFVEYPSRPGVTRVDTLGMSISCIL